jgi:hypothetical protein
MAKFNKDRFINDITGNVQDAINKGLIKEENIDSGDTEILESLIKYELTKYIEDRKFSIDVLRDFNYDEKIGWDALQEKYGTFYSLMDIALVNLWKFLESEGAIEYSYYHKATISPDANMLDVAREDDKFASADSGQEEIEETEPNIDSEETPSDENVENDNVDNENESLNEEPGRFHVRRRNRFS